MTKRILGQAATCLLFGVSLGYAVPASAVSFDLAGFNVNWTQDVSIGATWRVEGRDPGLVGKINLDPGFCIADVDNDLSNNDQRGAFSGDACSTGNPASNQAYVDAPGAFSVNGDNGNLNYDKWDTVTAAGKFLSEISISRGGWNLFVRGLAFFDEVNNDFLEFHPDTTLQPARTLRPVEADRVSGRRAELLDVYVSGGFVLPDFLGGNFLTVKVGDQVLNWGESTFLLPNSISSTNPLDQARLRLPGFNIAELFSPIGIVSLSTSLTANISAEVFYNYEWEPFTIDSPGTFFSTSDIPGATDRRFAMLSFGKQPEDPQRIYNPENNPDDAAGEVSQASRTVLFNDPIEPPDSGQYGIRLNYFADWLGDGTELSLYFMNYHSRLPYASAFAAQGTCIGEDAVNAGDLLDDCGVAAPGASNEDSFGRDVDEGGMVPSLAAEPLPVDTVRLAFQYPEDIKLYGFSWNTTVFDFAFSGEYAYRPDMPLQLNTVDLIFAALQPAFPNNNISAADAPALPGGGLPDLGGVLQGPGGTGNPATDVLVPNRRAAVPDFVQTIGRGESTQPGQLIEGFERVGYGKFDMTFLRTIGGSNFLNASRLLVIMELGFTHVDVPDLDQFQLSPAGIGTHISGGADGTAGRVDAFQAQGPDNTQAVCDDTCRQNPTSGTTAFDGLYDDFSAGYRFVLLPTYESLIWNVNVSPLFGWFHDFYGTTPGPAGSHVENRLRVFGGFRWDYLSSIGGEIRYTNFTNLGGTDRFIGNRDRDTLSAFIRYQF